MADNQKFVQAQSFSLAGSGVSITDTTMILTSLKDPDGNNITMTDIGSKGWMTIEPNSSDREEQISFTGITQNADGTATITGIKNVLFKAPYTETSGFLKSHPGGVKAVISNTAGFLDAMSSKKNDETIEGTWTFPDADANRARISSDTDTLVAEAFVTLGQLSRQAISGASNASETVKGIIELATATEAAAGTSSGATGARLVAPNSLVNETSSATRIIPITNASGKLSSGFGGAANSLATLNGSSLVVENPANATSTPTASKIVIALGTGKINTGWVDTGTGANQVVQLDGSSKLPAVDGSQLTDVVSYKNGVNSRDVSTASGDQVIAHGLGKIPKVVRISAMMNKAANEGNVSHGTYNGSTTATTYNYIRSSGNTANTDTTNIIFIPIWNGASNDNQVASVAVDGTNITLSWIKAGTPTGTIYFNWEVEG